jgi:hypothetical protein
MPLTASALSGDCDTFKSMLVDARRAESHCHWLRGDLQRHQLKHGCGAGLKNASSTE